MKSLGLCLLNIALLAMLVACGKENESGKSQWGINNPNSNPYIGPIGSGQAQSVLTTVINSYPCTSAMGNSRIPIQVPLTGSPFVVSPGDFHIGVTSYGDVAVITGTAMGQPPVFTAYMCPRSFAPTGQGQLYDVAIGSASARCSVKQITRATVVFPGGGVAAFRELTFGKYTTGQPFTPFCQ